MISNRNYKIGGIIFPASYALLYGLFNFIYIYGFKGTNANDNPYIYNILDWNNELRNLTGIFKNNTGYYYSKDRTFITNDYYELPENLKHNYFGLGVTWGIAIILLFTFAMFYFEFYGLAKLRDFLWAKYYHKKLESSEDTIVGIENPNFVSNSENLDNKNQEPEEST